ncbi:MAG: (2Fe-2S)-binding protein [Luteitalea sp.]|nr:(2Fe-2S)-binding protein [Luteitalea sp.]
MSSLRQIEQCPVSGATGRRVDVQTVKALLTASALRRLRLVDHRFCPDPRCHVVYFGADGTTYARNDLRVPVWQKEPFGDRMVCYCFGESERGIRTELEASGHSAAVARIREHIAAGRCACELRNPQGRCCLGDVTAAVTRVTQAIDHAVRSGS